MEYPNSHLNSKFEKRYGNEVLIGNWFEDRLACEAENSPKCPTYESEYIKQFKTITPCNRDTATAAMKIQCKNKKVRVKLFNKAEFYKNLTRSSDLHYGIIPKQTCGPIPRKYSQKTGTFEPQPDYAQSYGNLTNIGLINYKRHELQKEEELSKPISVLRADYTCPPKSAYQKSRT